MVAPSSVVLKQAFSLRWHPNKDLLAVILSWMLVTGALYIATFVVGSTLAGGMPYFAIYGVVTAALFGVGLPLYWTVVIRRRPIADLGITTQRLGLSIILQVVFAILQFAATPLRGQLPSMDRFLPLVALALAIGFFEAVFWRGWVLLRLEDAFGFLPALILGSLLYALYHIGYGMPASEIAFLFLIGVMYAVTFRLTKNVFLLWPLFQPMGQLITLTKDSLPLPMIAVLGFVEVLALMAVLVWLAARYYKQHGQEAA